MPKKLKMSFPVVAKSNRMIAEIMQAMRAIRMRSCGESLVVIARKAGTIAIGSRITNSELAASRTYSCRFMESEASLLCAGTAVKRFAFHRFVEESLGNATLCVFDRAFPPHPDPLPQG